MTMKLIAWKILTDVWSAMTSESIMNFDSGAQDVECGLIFSAQAGMTPLTVCVIIV
jgi:hypothetical protein